ncbi:MAG: maleylpyruvate isomerase family mycothiol-dependent enzyme [Micrococcales bacterium]|nr:maleylpyruvate isomerase family mycothiol-dependent enzyme [Micrococcales bacterium]
MRFSDVTLEQVDTETERVLTTAATLRDEALAAPSLCRGWSRGHVLAHLARNADALARVYAVGSTGVPDTMYDSDEARDADIDAGASSSCAAQVADLRESAARFAAQARRFDAAQGGLRVERTPGGRRIPLEKVLFMRLRELVYHHVDLDAGFTFGQASPEVLGMFLADAVKRLRSTPEPPGLTIVTFEGDEHTVGTGETGVEGSRAGVLLWLGREDSSDVRFDGPVPTLPFGG